MTGRQVRLIAELCEACWAHDEKRSVPLLIELLGDKVDDAVSERVKDMLKGYRNG